jgi:ribosomal protein S27AE
MAEENKWKKWEGPGEPPGKGGAAKPELSKSEEVEGRGKKKGAICFNCGAGSWMQDEWRWFTCWKCGALNYYEVD